MPNQSIKCIVARTLQDKHSMLHMFEFDHFKQYRFKAAAHVLMSAELSAAGACCTTVAFSA